MRRASNGDFREPSINIAVATSEALVFGCDSIASATQYLVNPFKVPSEKTKDNKIRFTVGFEDLTQHVTNTWARVTKMFELSDQQTPVAAVTAGLAKLNDRSMSSYANEFFSELRAAENSLNVDEVAAQFLTFIRGAYEKHYQDSAVPEEYRDHAHRRHHQARGIPHDR